jgi:uracil-DNA glycosylase family 4
MNTEMLHSELSTCNLCPRLREHCEHIAKVKRKSYEHEIYWGQPVPDLQSTTSPADLLIVGLAPGAHGANRTGRMITGDRSGDWLYRALYETGFSNQATSLHRQDGLKLLKTHVTCVVHCAPPDNRPTPHEIQKCLPYLQATLNSHPFKVIITLGKIATDTVAKHYQMKIKFKHGQQWVLNPHQTLLTSYHPSQQNTFTGLLTWDMFLESFTAARSIIQDNSL